MKTSTTIILFFYLVASCFCSIAKADVKSKIKELDQMFFNTSYSKYHVQLMVLSMDTPVDPPLNIANFPQMANVVISISSHSCYDELKTAINALKEMPLKKSPRDGYPNWMWRVVGPEGAFGLSIMVDVTNNLLYMEGNWYEAKPEMINLIIDQFISNLNDTLKKSRERNP